MTTLTYEKANELLDRAIAEKGADYVNEKTEYGSDGDTDCFYFTPEGVPSCIIGHVMHYLGFGPNDVNEHSAARAQPAIRQVAGEDVVSFLMNVQSKQDRGLPWGYAVEQARTDHYGN